MRPIRIATASFLMEDAPHSVERNLELALKYIRDASDRRADILLLPETCTTNRVSTLDHNSIPDWTPYFAKAAADHEISVIAPFYVREGDRVFNQATVFNQNGSVVGWYRKAQPTGREARFVSPGTEFPILEVAGARVAIMICMDIYFPEIVRIYAMKGAEIVFWPTITHGPTQSGLLSQLTSRAIDNSLHIVEANLAGVPPYAPYKGRFYPGNARIVDFNGDILAETGRREGLAIAEIDLDEKRSTLDCFLIEDLDDTRRDLESLARMDLFAAEYAALAEKQRRYYDFLSRISDDAITTP